MEQYKRFDYLTKINIQLEDDEYDIYIVDISKRPFSITFDYDDANIGEKEYKIIDTVIFNDREYRYNSAIMEIMGHNIVYNNAANIDMSEEGFINPFSHQMLLNILCGNYYIVIDTFYVDDIILEIMGIKKEEIKSNKSNFVCPRVDLTVERNVDYSKLKRYLENSRMIYGYKPVDFHYLYLLNGLFELEFNNCDEKQLACLDTEEYGCYYFVFGDTNSQITNWQISNIIKYYEEEYRINFDNDIKSMGIYIKFNNCICYSMTDGIFDIIPYICD